MTDSNRLQILRIREITEGVIPAGRAQEIAVVSESLDFAIDRQGSERIVNDRNSLGTFSTGARSNGGIDNELSYSMNQPEMASALFNDFIVIASITNSAADTEITGVTNATKTITVASGGTAFKAGHLVQLTGFGGVNNTGVHRVASSTATTVVLSASSTLTDEAVPPLGAKIRVVGFEGIAGDIQATATGLSSAALDFTTLGLSVGAFVKTGGSALVNQFSAGNGYSRITAITATAITMDNLPATWVVNAGTGKQIRVWAGDHAKNGVTKISHTYQKAYLEQSSPAFYQYRGMIVNTLDIAVSTGSAAKVTAAFLGKDQIISATTMDATPLTVADESVLNAVTDVKRVIEGGVDIGIVNAGTQLNMQINNNLRERPAIGVFGSLATKAGSCDVTGSLETYFDTKTLVEKYVNDTKTNLGVVLEKAGSGLAVFIPTVNITAAPFSAGGRNQDVKAQLQFSAQKTKANPYSISIDVFHYVEGA